MSDIRQTFTSDVSRLENDLNKIQGQYLKLKESMGATAKEGKQGGDAMAGLGSAMQSAFIGLGGSLLTAGGAIAALIAGQKAFNEEITRAREQTKELNAELLQGLSLRGQGGRAEEVKAWAVAKANETGLTEKSLEVAHAAVLEGAIGATPERQKTLAAAAAARAPMAGEEGAAATAREMGYLNRLLSKQTPQAIRSVSEHLSQTLPANVRQAITSAETLRGMQEMVAGGAATPEQVLGTAAALAKKEISPEIIARVMGAVYDTSEEAPAIPTGQRATPEQAAEARLSGMKPAERLTAIFSDAKVREELLGTRAARKLTGITPADIEASVAGIKTAETSDETANQLANLPETAYKAQYKKYQEDVQRRAYAGSHAGMLGKRQEEDIRKRKLSGDYTPYIDETGQAIERAFNFMLPFVGGNYMPGPLAMPSEKTMTRYWQRGGEFRERPPVAPPVQLTPQQRVSQHVREANFPDPSNPANKELIEELRKIGVKIDSNQATNAAAAARGQKE